MPRPRPAQVENGSVVFDGLIKAEGSKGCPAVCVPAEARRLLKQRGFEPPGWTRVRLGDADYIAWMRPPTGTASVLPVPVHAGTKVVCGTEVCIRLDDAKPLRAKPLAACDGFDWLPLVDETRYFPIESDDGTLTLHSRHEAPFSLRRVTPWPQTARLLGLYQAEGSKSEGGGAWTLSGSNPELLRLVVELLRALGIGPERVLLEVLHAKDESPEAAVGAFAGVSARLTSVRLRSGRGGNAGCLLVEHGLPLRRLTIAALAQVFADGLPTTEAAREYALGWLDGDGTITLIRGKPLLRLAGNEIEIGVALRALNAGLGLALSIGAYDKRSSFSTCSLRFAEAVELACAGAFRYSMSRARLLLSTDEQRRRLQAMIDAQRGRYGAAYRWGLLTRDARGHSARTAETQRADDRLQTECGEEIRRLREMLPRGLPRGVKGLVYPLTRAGKPE